MVLVRPGSAPITTPKTVPAKIMSNIIGSANEKIPCAMPDIKFSIFQYLRS